MLYLFRFICFTFELNVLYQLANLRRFFVSKKFPKIGPFARHEWQKGKKLAKGDYKKSKHCVRFNDVEVKIYKLTEMVNKTFEFFPHFRLMAATVTALVTISKKKYLPVVWISSWALAPQTCAHHRFASLDLFVTLATQ